MAEQTFSENPQTSLLEQLAQIAEVVFSENSDRLITEPAVRRLLNQMFWLLARASDANALNTRLEHLRKHGSLADALKERGYQDVRTVNEDVSTTITSSIREKWFPNAPTFGSGPKMSGP